MRRQLYLALCTIVCAAALLWQPSDEATSAPLDEAEQRKPFSLELPDIGGEPITASEAVIPTHDLHTLRLRVHKPYSDRINYGKIYTKINGEAAGTIQDIRSTRDGYNVICNLDSKPRFRLQPGKNVVEINAIDQSGKSYYASYVLLTGNRTGGDSGAVASGATIEILPVQAGSDREPPTILLQQPTGALRMTAPAGTYKVYGVVADNSGAVASVLVNRQAAALSPPSEAGMRGLKLVLDANPGASAPASNTAAKGLAFERTVQIGPDTSSVVIEAKDDAGNVARMTIPVKRREAAISTQFRGRKFALIIGVSRYKYHDGGLTDLAYPDADARSIRDFLQRREGGGFNASDISYLENEQATTDGVRGALARILPRAGTNDLLFIFIAGHGAPDPYAPQTLYFLLHDTKVADMPRTALPMTELQEILDNSVRAERVVIFVDTCHSAGLSGEKLVATRGIENNLINLYATRLYTETGRAVLTSSDVNEVSRESERWGGGHGIFTWALLEGLRGEADANADNLITAGELFVFVRDRVRIETAFRQNPRVLPGANADLTLGVVSNRTARAR
jgi:hypothetical protein